MLFSLCWAGSGCSGPKKPVDMPNLTPCQLTFTQEGAPVKGLYVLFQKEGMNSDWPSSGVTDQAGHVEIFTLDKFSGVPEGNYTLVLTLSESEPNPDPNAFGLDRFYSLIDEKYTKLETSPLKLTVGNSAIQEKFDLGKKVKTEITP